MKLKKVLLSSILLFSLATSHAELKEGVDYIVLPKTIPQLDNSKIEVLEFFAYFCVHCKNLEPILLKHVKTFPSDVSYRSEHIVWDPNAINLARIASAINTSGTLYQASPAVFEAMFDKPSINLNDPAIFKKWAAGQGKWGQSLLNAYNSPTNLADAQRMEKMTMEYGISATPALIVGGKYQLQLRDFVSDMSKLDELIAKVRKERRQMGSAKPTVLKSIGAKLAEQAK